MTFIDERGRLFGKINIIDLTIAVFVLLLIPIGFYAYTLFKVPMPTITAVSPATVVIGKDQRIHLTGTGFRPYMNAGIGVHKERPILVESPTSADIILRPEYEPGTYDLILLDEQRELIRMAGALVFANAVAPAPGTVLLKVAGTFRNLSPETAAAIRAGANFPAGSPEPSVEIVSASAPKPEFVRISTSSGLLEAPVPDRSKVSAVVRLRCMPIGDFCKIGDVTIAAGASVSLSGFSTPFDITEVTAADRPLTLAAASVQTVFELEARMLTIPETVSMLLPGTRDMDRRLLGIDGSPPPAASAAATLVSFKKDGDVSALSSMDWLGLDIRTAPQVTGIGRTLAAVSAVFKVPVERTPTGWQYKGSAIKLGAPLYFDGPLYTMRGWITAIKGGAGAAPHP